MTSNILVINQYYAPDIAASGQLLAELCQSLANSDLRVTVIAAQPSYVEDAESAAEHEIDEYGVEIYRVDLGRSVGRSSLLRRLTGYLKFLWKAAKLANTIAEEQRLDTVVTMSNPPFVNLLGALLRKRFGFRYVGIIHDIYPQAITESRRIWLPPGVGWIWNRFNRWVSTKASKLIVLSSQMRETLVETGIDETKIEVIPNWARPDLGTREADSGIRAKFGVHENELLLLYSGNFGIIHNLNIIIEAANLLRDVRAKYVFVGGGDQENRLKTECTKLGILNVSFHSYLPEVQYSTLISSADACFVGLVKGMERYSEPSKIYSVLSAGIPVITLMSRHANQAQMVADAGAGWNAENAEELGEIVRELARTSSENISGIRGRSRELYEEQFTREIVIRRYVEVLADVSRKPG